LILKLAKLSPLIYDETQSFSRENKRRNFEIISPSLSSSSQPPIEQKNENFFSFYFFS